jgi:hypothetical protein
LVGHRHRSDTTADNNQRDQQETFHDLHSFASLVVPALSAISWSPATLLIDGRELRPATRIQACLTTVTTPQVAPNDVSACVVGSYAAKKIAPDRLGHSTN